MFVVNGATYALFAPIWGYVCDKKLAPIIVTAIGSVLMFVSFLFIGPAPFFPFHTVSLCKICNCTTVLRLLMKSYYYF